MKIIKMVNIESKETVVTIVMPTNELEYLRPTVVEHMQINDVTEGFSDEDLKKLLLNLIWKLT